MPSKLRPECNSGRGTGVLVPDDTALFLIRDAVEKRKGLIRGQLRDGAGHTCAMGAFWDDNPRLTVSWEVLEEVAAVNDSLPPSATMKERWLKVRSWLRWKVRVKALKNSG